MLREAVRRILDPDEGRGKTGGSFQKWGGAVQVRGVGGRQRAGFHFDIRLQLVRNRQRQQREIGALPEKLDTREGRKKIRTRGRRSARAARMGRRARNRGTGPAKGTESKSTNPHPHHFAESCRGSLRKVRRCDGRKGRRSVAGGNRRKSFGMEPSLK